MRKIVYALICVVLTVLWYKVSVLERVSDMHGKTMDVMLDTSERLVGEVNFLIGFVDEEDLLETLDDGRYEITEVDTYDWTCSDDVDYPKYIPEETSLIGRPITEETAFMTHGQLLQYWKKHDQDMKGK